MMYRLKFLYNDSTATHMEYYSGGTYIFHGEKYACITGFHSDAKLFRSQKTAESAYNKLHKSCVNVPSDYEIEDCSSHIL